MRFGADSLAVLERASRGPAQSAERLRRAQLAGLGCPCGDYSGARMIAGLGADATTTKVASTVASTATTYALAQGGGAALSAGAYATMGAAAGPIGMAVGLIVGIVVTKLLTKQYLNVPQMNAAEDAEVTVYNQYMPIMGKVAGRAIGLDAMKAIWKGALHSGRWAKNNVRQCFHEGCSKYPGNASLIDMVIAGGCGDRNCFPDLLPKFLAGRAAQAASAPAVMASRTVVRPGVIARGGGMMRGLGAAPGMGALGAVPTPDAVIFIDKYFVPANSPPAPCGRGGCYWAAPANATERQILYDVADAWLATQAIQTTPYVAQATPVPVVTPVTTAARPVVKPMPVTPAVTGAGGGSTAAGPGGGGTYDLVPVQTPSGVVYQPRTDKLATPVTAGLSQLPAGAWLMAAAGLAFALARPGATPRRKKAP